jgi:PAS domain S-box-containing protein
MFERPQHSLRELIQFSPLAIEELDPEGKVKLWNTAAEQMFGWRESEVLGRAYPAIPAESRAEFEDEMRHVHKGATIQSKLVRRQRQDGRQFDARLWAAPIHNERNQVIGITKILEDVTAQKAAEERLLLQSAVLQATANSIVITDDQGTILWTNPAFSQLTGYGSEEVLGKNPRLLKSGRQDSAFYTNMWATITSGNVWRGEVVNRCKDGSLYNEEMTSRTRAARAYASSSPTSPRLAQGKRPRGSGPSRLLDVQRLQVEESRIAPASSSRTIQTKHPFNIDIIHSRSIQDLGQRMNH